MTERSTDSIMAEIQRGEAKAAARGGEHLLSVAQGYTPVDTGRLRDSAHVVVDGTKAAVVYDSTIAAAVHEDMTVEHSPGTSAKFLERAMVSERDALRRIVAAEIRRTIEG